MLKKIAIAVVVLVAGVLGFAATKPDTFRIERSATIKAKPEAVYALIHDFHKWEAWSPWEKMDPAMKRSFSGPAQGKGAVYTWDGNDHAGAGSMEIKAAEASKHVGIDLSFTRPMQSASQVDFNLEPQGETTKVTWAMSGPMPFVSKVMCVFMDMDKMIGPDFEKGLAAMKTAAEK